MPYAWLLAFEWRYKKRDITITIIAIITPRESEMNLTSRNTFPDRPPHGNSNNRMVRPGKKIEPKRRRETSVEATAFGVNLAKLSRILVPVKYAV